MATDAVSNNAFVDDNEPPAIAGVRRSFIEARGVRFHVTEAGPADGRPVIALHGWPQHHWAYRDLLADPPSGGQERSDRGIGSGGQERSDRGIGKGLRIIAPDLPGYGWSGPPPHRWYKDEIAADVLALADAMGLDRFLLVGHDWGGFVGHRMVLQAPERIDGYLVLNMAHPWQSTRTVLPHLWRFLIYQPMVAAVGVTLQQRTDYLKRVIFGVGGAAHRLDPEVVRVYTDRFRDPVVARAARDTYRTFLLHELPSGARHPETKRATVPIRALFGLADIAVHRSLAAPETANADDYTFEAADTGHFILDERPDLVRARLIALAEETAPQR